MGVPYLLPVNPIVKYQTRLDEQMVPVAEVPRRRRGHGEALERLLEDARIGKKFASLARRGDRICAG